MLIVDPATGAMWELPSNVSTALSAAPTEASGVQQASHSEPGSEEPVELY